MFRREPLSMPFADQLVDLCRVVLSDGRVEPAPPGHFVTAAVAHRVTGACVQALHEGQLILGEADARTLRDAHAVATLGTALAGRELHRVAAEIEAATSAPAIVLKGPAISDRLYPDPGLRPYGDLDLIVTRGSLEAARGALSAIGYEERVQLRPGFEVAHGHTIDMVRAVGRKSVEVEVHWRGGGERGGGGVSPPPPAGDGEAGPRGPRAPGPPPPGPRLGCAPPL